MMTIDESFTMACLIVGCVTEADALGRFDVALIMSAASIEEKDKRTYLGKL